MCEKSNISQIIEIHSKFKKNELVLTVQGLRQGFYMIEQVCININSLKNTCQIEYGLRSLDIMADNGYPVISISSNNILWVDDSQIVTLTALLECK